MFKVWITQVYIFLIMKLDKKSPSEYREICFPNQRNESKEKYCFKYRLLKNKIGKPFSHKRLFWPRNLWGNRIFWVWNKNRTFCKYSASQAAFEETEAKLTAWINDPSSEPLQEQGLHFRSSYIHRKCIFQNGRDILLKPVPVSNNWFSCSREWTIWHSVATAFHFFSGNQIQYKFPPLANSAHQTLKMNLLNLPYLIAMRCSLDGMLYIYSSF